MFSNIVRALFPKTYDSIFRLGVSFGTNREWERNRNERARFRCLEQKQWLDKKVIIVSNNWEDPFIGIVVGIQDFSADEAHLVVRDAVTHEEFISFGKVVHFSYANLKAVTEMNPWVRWELLTGQKLENEIPVSAPLKSYDQLVKELTSAGFLKNEIEDFPSIFKTIENNILN